MAELRDSVPGGFWPDGLEVYDPTRWSCEQSWHLARALVAPDKLACLNEIRAACGRPPVRRLPVLPTFVRRGR